MEQDPKSKKEYLLEIINDILDEKEGADPVNSLPSDTSLSEDIGLDSLDLAEITVRLQDKYGVDIFENDVVDEVGEVLEKLES